MTWRSLCLSLSLSLFLLITDDPLRTTRSDANYLINKDRECLGKHVRLCNENFVANP